MYQRFLLPFFFLASVGVFLTLPQGVSAQVAPIVEVLQDAATPPEADLGTTKPDTALFSFYLHNTSAEGVMVTAVNATVSSTPYWADTSETPTIRNYRLIDERTGAQKGGTVFRATLMADLRGRIRFEPTDIYLSAGASARFTLHGEVAPLTQGALSGSGHLYSLEQRPQYDMLDGYGLATGRPIEETGMALGNTQMVYAAVMHTRLHPLSPSGPSMPGFNQTIAIFHVWKDQYGERDPELNTLSFWLDSNIVLPEGRDVRVYKNDVNPENLIGTGTIASLPGGVYFNVGPIAMTGTEWSPDRIYLRMDTHDAVPGNFMQATLSVMWYSDTITTHIGTRETPIAAGRLTY